MSPEYREQGGHRVFVNIAHPGLIKTDTADAIGDVSAEAVCRVCGADWEYVWH
jgi:hypothetical protein